MYWKCLSCKSDTYYLETSYWSIHLIDCYFDIPECSGSGCTSQKPRTEGQRMFIMLLFFFFASLFRLTIDVPRLFALRYEKRPHTSPPTFPIPRTRSCLIPRPPPRLCCLYKVNVISMVTWVASSFFLLLSRKRCLVSVMIFFYGDGT